jgi:hypothetical protein
MARRTFIGEGMSAKEKGSGLTHTALRNTNVMKIKKMDIRIRYDWKRYMGDYTAEEGALRPGNPKHEEDRECRREYAGR